MNPGRLTNLHKKTGLSTGFFYPVIFKLGHEQRSDESPEDTEAENAKSEQRNYIGIVEAQ